MSIDDLSEQLRNLQDELTCLNAAEQRTPDEIEKVLSSISEQLEQETQTESEDQQKVQLQNFTEYLHKFEADHPELTASVNRVLVTLGNMGI